MPSKRPVAAEEKERPLTNDEIRKLRAIMESDERVRWFWGTVRAWAVWISAVVLGGTVGFDFLGKVIRSLGKA